MDIQSEKFSKGFELMIAALLGITAVLTAWAAWQGSLYDGNQAQAYTEATAVISDANQYYNEADQMIVQDTQTWNEISSLRVDMAFAESEGDANEVERIQYKLDYLMYNNVSEDLEAAIAWADEQEDYVSPFEMEGFIETYYTVAEEEYAKYEAKIEEGNTANNLGDKQGLVTVVLAVVLFMLGILGTFNNTKTKIVIMAVSIAALIFGVVIMCGVPIVWVG